MTTVVQISDRKRSLTKRGAAVRQRLLELATLIISRDGYAATTLQKLTDESALGRGSVLHQFPMRPDLIEAVTRHIGDKLVAETRAELSGIESPMERLKEYPDRIWYAANSVPGIALAEIGFAARWDQELHDRIQPEIARMNDLIAADLAVTATHAGIEDLEALRARVQCLTASAHGLVLEKNLHHDYAMIQASVEAMKRDFDNFLARSRSKDSKIASL